MAKPEREFSEFDLVLHDEALLFVEKEITKIKNRLIAEIRNLEKEIYSLQNT